MYFNSAKWNKRNIQWMLMRKEYEWITHCDIAKPFLSFLSIWTYVSMCSSNNHTFTVIHKEVDKFVLRCSRVNPTWASPSAVMLGSGRQFTNQPPTRTFLLRTGMPSLRHQIRLIIAATFPMAAYQLSDGMPWPLSCTYLESVSNQFNLVWNEYQLKRSIYWGRGSICVFALCPSTTLTIYVDCVMWE